MIRRALLPLLVGRCIAKVATTRASYFFLTSPQVIAKRLPGRTVVALERHGKYLLADLDNGSRLLMHLGMSGQLFSRTAKVPRLLSSTRGSTLPPEAQEDFIPDEHTHVAFHFVGGGESVYFRDPRKFGKILLLASGERASRLDRLGPDALGLSPRTLGQACKRRRIAIKALLLDQSVTAGIGNIYADEALFRARLHPLRSALSLSDAEHKLLATSVKQVLRRAIATGGSSISDYIAPDGSRGRYQDERRVYARTGLSCLACHATIERLVVGGRSTHFCPTCQV